MPITRREAKEIVDWVIQEINRRRFPYVTDGRLDLSKSPVGTISGTPTAGGPIAEGAIWDRHVHPNADVQGTKVRIATSSERGTVQLADDGSAIIITLSGMSSTASGYGASLVGIEDAAGNFVGIDVEAALAELAADIVTSTFIGLTDTPSGYGAADQVPFINETEDALEFRHIDYFDGGDFSETYDGVVTLNREHADGGSFTKNVTLDGGSF